MKQQLSVISQGGAKPEDYVESLADFPLAYLSSSSPLSLSLFLLVPLFVTPPCGQLPLQFQLGSRNPESRLSLGATPAAACLVFASPSPSPPPSLAFFALHPCSAHF